MWDLWLYISTCTQYNIIWLIYTFLKLQFLTCIVYIINKPQIIFPNLHFTVLKFTMFKLIKWSQHRNLLTRILFGIILLHYLIQNSVSPFNCFYLILIPYSRKSFLPSVQHTHPILKFTRLLECVKQSIFYKRKFKNKHPANTY